MNELTPEEHKAFAALFIGAEDQLLADEPPYDYNYILSVFGGCCVPTFLMVNPADPLTKAVARVLSFQPKETPEQVELIKRMIDAYNSR